MEVTLGVLSGSINQAQRWIVTLRVMVVWTDAFAGKPAPTRFCVSRQSSWPASAYRILCPSQIHLACQRLQGFVSTANPPGLPAPTGFCVLRKSTWLARAYKVLCPSQIHLACQGLQGFVSFANPPGLPGPTRFCVHRKSTWLASAYKVLCPPQILCRSWLASERASTFTTKSGFSRRDRHPPTIPPAPTNPAPWPPAPPPAPPPVPARTTAHRHNSTGCRACRNAESPAPAAQ